MNHGIGTDGHVVSDAYLSENLHTRRNVHVIADDGAPSLLALPRNSDGNALRDVDVFA